MTSKGSVEENISSLRGVARKMRQQDAVGSFDDELVISRAIIDLQELLTLVKTLTAKQQDAGTNNQ